MKTQYEKLYKYGFGNILFGKTRKKDYVIFWALIALILIIGLMVQH